MDAGSIFARRHITRKISPSIFLEVLTSAYILREINLRLLAIGEEIRLEVELMQVPLKITFRNVRKTPDLEALIDKQAAKLERVCNHLASLSGVDR